jgi:chemotaxis protein MotB
VLFAKASAELIDAGKQEMDKLAQALLELEKEIPGDIAWVLRVDGHTDNDPITSAQFKSNWELSAARSIAVVNYLISKGVQPVHLVAAGFGEFQPLDPADTEDAKSRNRRIELKLTER